MLGWRILIYQSSSLPLTNKTQSYPRSETRSGRFSKEKRKCRETLNQNHSGRSSLGSKETLKELNLEPGLSRRRFMILSLCRTNTTNNVQTELNTNGFIIYQ